MITRLGVASFLLAALLLHAQQPLPEPPAPLPPVPGKVFTVTPEAGYNNEPSIAVNAVMPAQVIAAFQKPARVVYSQDGGASWNPATGTAPADYAVSGDVSVIYDRHGTAILCYIAFDHLGTMNYWAHGATRNGIYVRRSTDGGATWEKQAHAVIEHATQPGIPFEDKPYIAADNTGSKYAGNLYVGWTEFRLDESVILFSRSTDGGVTWSAPITISTHHGLPRDDNGAVEGWSGAVAGDGTLYSVWADGNSIVMAVSHDGGKTFEKSRVILETAPLYFAAAGLDRANGFPQIAIDPRHGRKGLLYVTWSDYRAGDIGVYCATSADGGKSWSPPVRANSNPPHDGTDQFFQWLAVDPATGAANIIFYDRRMDSANRKTTVTLARSTDSGRSFANYAWTRDAFIPKSDDFLGDYIGGTSLNGKVYGIWTESVADGTKREPLNDSGQSRYRTAIVLGIADFNGTRQ